MKAKTKLAATNIGDKIEESDYCVVSPDGDFIQFEYIESKNDYDPYKVFPGIYSINKTVTGLKLKETSFVKDSILDTFVSTKEIAEKIDCFFNNLNIYKEEGIEVPTRKALLFGPPGGGKSTAISKSVEKYLEEKDTLVCIWHTDKFESYQVKDFIKSFEYKKVSKMILIAEDIGGVEIEQTRMKSDSSLLSLLDNQEKTFKIPTFIIATTNFPENFMGNLTNRPGRFDDKIEMSYPNAQQRKELLTFFTKGLANEEELTLIGSNSCSKFSPAHIRDIRLRSKLYSKTIKQVIKETSQEIEYYEKCFSKKGRMGILED